ncbi:MAG: anti-sigma F factor [Clostridia bacterium]|nr:anti-sigma F factor [Clostridia bacterium]
MKNEMRLLFDAHSSNEAFARTAVAAFVMQLDPTLEEISDIKTALSEAVTNAIVHGYEEAEGVVEVHCRVEGRSITVSVTDTGKGIADIQKAMEPLYTGKPEAERSGMGFTVMEAFMDSVSVQSILNEGTTVTMEKQLRAHDARGTLFSAAETNHSEA